MTEDKDIERLRARIQHQRRRLWHDEPVEPAMAEAVPDAQARRFSSRRQAGGRDGGSVLGSLGRVMADHPALAIGVGAAIVVAGPQRSLRLARRAVRGAVVVLGAYRGLATVLDLLAGNRPAHGGTGRHDDRRQGAPL